MSDPIITLLIHSHNSQLPWQMFYSDGGSGYTISKFVPGIFNDLRQPLPAGWETAEPGWWALVEPPVKREPLPTLERWLSPTGRWFAASLDINRRALTHVVVTFDADDTPHVTVERAQ